MAVIRLFLTCFCTHVTDSTKVLKVVFKYQFYNVSFRSFHSLLLVFYIIHK